MVSCSLYYSLVCSLGFIVIVLVFALASGRQYGYHCSQGGRSDLELDAVPALTVIGNPGSALLPLHTLLQEMLHQFVFCSGSTLVSENELTLADQFTSSILWSIQVDEMRSDVAAGDLLLSLLTLLSLWSLLSLLIVLSLLKLLSLICDHSRLLRSSSWGVGKWPVFPNSRSVLGSLKNRYEDEALTPSR